MQTGNSAHPLILLACAGKRLQRPGLVTNKQLRAVAAGMHACPEPGRVRIPHAPALDGLRALAVGAVLLYHAGVSWMPGGFLGVEVFFVISGYLITSLLLAEWSTTGRIDLAGFWLRRARRLLPALYVLLPAVIAFAVIFLPEEVAGIRGDAVSGAWYVNNWYQIFSHKSYFENVGRPSLLRHLWSLAVEEQFYLLWPLIFCVLMQWRQQDATTRGHEGGEGCTKNAKGYLDAQLPRAEKQRLNFRSLRIIIAPIVSSPVIIVMCGAAGCALWMAVQYVPETDPLRIYFGTDTRASGILLGAALAFLRLQTSNRLNHAADIAEGAAEGAAPSKTAWVWGVTGLIALVGLAFCLLRISEFQPFLYRGGFFLTSLATVALIATAVQAPGSLVGRIFAWTPLRWIGVRSYGIYLWHFPIFMGTRPQLDVALGGAWLLAARLGMTVLIAALSYRFLELPIRQGVLEHCWRAWRLARGHKRRWLGACGAAAVSAVAALLVVCGALLFSAKTPPPAEYLTVLQAPDHTTNSPGRSACPLAAEEPRARDCAPYAVTNVCPTACATVADMVPGTAITAIGDSVMLGVRDELLRTLGTNVLVDAEVGRQARHALAAVRKLRAAGQIRPIVILHIGANGFVSAAMFDKIMAELADAREVLVVNVKVPRSWETPNNAMLAEAVARYPKAVLVDWHAASEERPELFWKDGHHLRPKGAVVYADLIAQALRRTTAAPEALKGPRAAGDAASLAREMHQRHA